VRREDGTLLIGEGRFTGDLRPDGLLTAYFVGSPVAHAEVASVDCEGAAKCPGVVGVYTAETIGVEQVKPRFPLDPHFGRGPLASDRVRFVGEPVAMVVAESLAAAQDAADEIMVDYEPLPVSLAAEAAVANGAAVLFPGRGSDSIFRVFDPVDGLHDGADRIITGRIVHNRMAVVPMETDAVLVDPTGEPLTLWVSTQGAHNTRAGIAESLVRLLEPFEVEVRVYDPYLASEMPDAIGVVKTSLEQVLSKSDVIVCLAPHTPATEGMIGQRELDLIPSNAVFVNVSRGVVVDSEALIERLKRGDIVAGLDVFDPEPIPPDSEIIGLPNVFLSPHIAGVTLASRHRFFSLMVDEMERFFGGEEPLFELTPSSMANRRGLGTTEG